MECTTISQNEAGIPKAEAINTTALYTKAILLFGKKKQTDMAIEEMSELTKALLKYRRNPCVEKRVDIIEEIADVQIMLDQLRIMYDMDDDVNRIQFEKQQRLKGIMEQM